MKLKAENKNETKGRRRDRNEIAIRRQKMEKCIHVNSNTKLKT